MVLENDVILHDIKDKRNFLHKAKALFGYFFAVLSKIYGLHKLTLNSTHKLTIKLVCDKNSVICTEYY